MALIVDNEASTAINSASQHTDSKSTDIAEWEEETYFRLTSTNLSPEQVARLTQPETVFPQQRVVLAIHWHPEWIPLEVIERRLEACFPNCTQRLAIPTQHNQFMSFDGYVGAEVDCYSTGFNRKVQLLIHFRQERLPRAGVLSSMLDHTFRYRASQLWELMDSLSEPAQERRLQEAAAETGANEDLVDFVRQHTGRLKRLVLEHQGDTPLIMLKNKLVNDYFDAQRIHHPGRVINRAQLLIKAVKQIVKREFSLQYFYRASEIIEEARTLGAGVVIPHPEQFWPILLAEYDVDGYEVWNPQSREYTEFLIKVLTRHNKEILPGARRLLIFMGDDTHLSEKGKEPALQNHSKARREVGWQPAWEDLAIRKALMLAGMDRARVIDEYQSRLA